MVYILQNVPSALARQALPTPTTSHSFRLPTRPWWLLRSQSLQRPRNILPARHDTNIGMPRSVWTHVIWAHTRGLSVLHATRLDDQLGMQA